MRSSPLPVNGHTVLETRDIDTAEQTLSRCFLPLRLRTTRPAPSLDTRLNTIDLGQATVGAIRFQTEVSIRTDEAESFHVDIPLAGVAVSRPGAAEPLVTKPGSAQVFMPGETADLQWSAGTRQLCVMVQRPFLERHLTTLLGSDLPRPVTFRSVMDLRSPGGGTWLQALKLVDHELRRDNGLLEHNTTRRTLERVLVESLLLGHEHNYSEQLRRVPDGAGAGPVRTAIDVLEAHPERPWTAGALAAEVGLSVRGLHAGFRNRTGVGPMTYLRGVRLARVHDDLLSADPETTTVSATARRWGFAHLGRFAATYTQRYGCSPSGTLHGLRPPL